MVHGRCCDISNSSFPILITIYKYWNLSLGPVTYIDRKNDVATWWKKRWMFPFKSLRRHSACTRPCTQSLTEPYIEATLYTRTHTVLCSLAMSNEVHCLHSHRTVYTHTELQNKICAHVLSVVYSLADLWASENNEPQELCLKEERKVLGEQNVTLMHSFLWRDTTSVPRFILCGSVANTAYDTADSVGHDSVVSVGHVSRSGYIFDILRQIFWGWTWTK